MENGFGINSRKFSLPGKKSLLNSSLDTELIIMDIIESSIETSTNIKNSFIAVNTHEHTLKTQLIIE